jgi:hypothetical protein
MAGRLKTLVLDANGFDWRSIAADTVVQGLLGVRDYERIPQRLRGVRFFRGLRSRYDALSYLGDWRQAITASPALDVSVCNITNLADYARYLRRLRDFDLILVLHVATADSLPLLVWTAARLRRREGKLAVFIGNEYEAMDAKIAFLRAARADYVCSQLPIASARWLYAEAGGAEVLAMPHGLSPSKFHPPATLERPFDVGFVGWMYGYFIGDVERTRIIRKVRDNCDRWGLKGEFREGTEPSGAWAEFLGRCNGTVGAESGTYYLDRRGAIIERARAFEREHPGATFEEIHERFFAKPAAEVVSGKCASSRHFEAIGTQTCQILLEGQYNDILEPELHYVCVKKDLSDIDDAVERFKDDAYRAEIVARAYEYVMDEHTYAHRVQALVRSIGGA